MVACVLVPRGSVGARCPLLSASTRSGEQCQSTGAGSGEHTRPAGCLFTTLHAHKTRGGPCPRACTEAIMTPRKRPHPGRRARHGRAQPGSRSVAGGRHQGAPRPVPVPLADPARASGARTTSSLTPESCTASAAQPAAKPLCVCACCCFCGDAPWQEHPLWPAKDEAGGAERVLPKSWLCVPSPIANLKLPPPLHPGTPPPHPWLCKRQRTANAADALADPLTYPPTHQSVTAASELDAVSELLSNRERFW